MAGWLGSNSNWLIPAALTAASLWSNNDTNNRRETMAANMDRLAAAQAARSNWMANQESGGSGASAPSVYYKLTPKAAKAASALAKEYYAKAQTKLQPYNDAATNLLPSQTDAYKAGLAATNSLAAILAKPENKAKLDQETSQLKMNIPIPEYLKRG